MSTIIQGHKLTDAERRVLDELIDFMRKNAGDSGWGPNTSPKGDGEWIHLWDIYSERGNRFTAKRRTAFRLYKLGILAACEIEYDPTRNALHGDPGAIRRFREASQPA